MKRFFALIALVVLVAGCGASRDSEFASDDSETASTVGEADQADGASTDSASADADPEGDGSETPVPTTVLPEVVPDTTGVPTEQAMSATFGGSEWEITHGELNDIVGPTVAEDKFSEVVFGGQPAVGFGANVLTQLFVSEVLRVELETEGVEVSQTDLDRSQEALVAELQTLMTDDPDPAATVAGFFEDEPYLQFLTEFQARQELLSTTLVVGVESTEQSLPCAKHILVETVEEADGIVTELAEGGDFAAIAMDRSLDPGSGAQGGELGCADPANYVPEFKAAIEGAEIGEVVGPVETQFGAHIIVVDRIETSEVPVDGRQIATELLQERLGSAEVVVDPAVGTWNSQVFAIEPAQ